MSQATFELAAGLVLDARRAVWFSRSRVLVVADVHLGYPWAQRRRGQLLPVPPLEDALPRLVALQRDYQPTRLVFLGDLVHEASPLIPIENELKHLTRTLAAQCPLTLIAGNHDHRLERLVDRWKLPLAIKTCEVLDSHLLLHGDVGDQNPDVVDWRQKRKSGARLVMGHEHPAVSLGDNLARMAKCPCFLVAADCLVLPAFSSWAAGCDVRKQDFISELTKTARWQSVIAIMGNRLLEIPGKQLGLKRS